MLSLDAAAFARTWLGAFNRKDLQYEPLRLHVGVDRLTLVYLRSGGKIVAETFHLDARGFVVRALVAHAEA